MTNIINSKTTKVALGLMVALFVLTAFAVSASAALTQPLKAGMSGAAVMELQSALISKGYSIPAGATGFFGNQTKAAVMAFQTAYASEVLTPAGLSVASGYFGMYSLAKLNALMASPAPTPTPTPTPTPVVGTEGSVAVTLESSPGNNTEILYNQEKAVEAIKFKATGSDMKINRLDVNFNKRLWLYASVAALYDGSTKIAEIALTQSALEEVTLGSDYRLRFALDYTVPKDTSKVLTLKLTAPSIITDPGTNIIATVNANAVRATSTIGLTEYEPSTALATRTFDVNTNSTGNLTVSIDAASPIANTSIVDDVNVTSDVPLLVADVKATNSDITMSEMIFNIATTTANVDDVADAIKLYKGSTLVGTATLGTCTTACTATFSDLNEVIAKDATVKYTLKADLKADDGVNYSDAETIGAKLDIAAGAYTNISAEDAIFTSLANAQMDGTADGTTTSYKQHLYVYAPVISFISASASKSTPTTGADIGNYVIKFSVKAQGGDIYIDHSVTTDVTAAVGNMTAQSTASTGTVTSSAVLASTSTTDGTYGFKVIDGTTETFTLTVASTDSAAAFVKEALSGIGWDTDDVQNSRNVINYGLTNFKTDNAYLSLNA